MSVITAVKDLSTKVTLKDIKLDTKTLHLLFVAFVADNLDIRAVLLGMCVVLRKTLVVTYVAVNSKLSGT